MAPVRTNPLTPHWPQPIAMSYSEQETYRPHLALYRDDELISELLRRKRVEWLHLSTQHTAMDLEMVKDRGPFVSHVRQGMAAQLGHHLLENNFMRWQEEYVAMTDCHRFILRLLAVKSSSETKC